MYKMVALWHIDPKLSVLKEAAAFGGADTLIKAAYSLISTGTERLVACGDVPVSMHASMAVPYMEGHLGLPVKYGYSLVGEVLSSNTLAQGTRVHLMHPHQDVCSIRDIDAIPVPDTVPLKRALLAANMETAINAVWDAGLTEKAPVLIAGYGTVGALLARLCSSHFGCTVSVLENNPLKKALVEAHGYRLAGTDDEEYPFTFHCAASGEALQYCIDRAAPESAVIELSWYGTRNVSLSLGGSFHRGRKKIIASQVSEIPPHKKNEWTYARRKEYAFRLLGDDFFDCLLTNEIPFHKSADFFNQNRNNPLPGIGYYISY